MFGFAAPAGMSEPENSRPTEYEPAQTLSVSMLILVAIDSTFVVVRGSLEQDEWLWPRYQCLELASCCEVREALMTTAASGIEAKTCIPFLRRDQECAALAAVCALPLS